MSDLQQICADLVACVDDGVAMSRELAVSADRLRSTAGAMGALAAGAGPLSSELRRLVHVLDTAARECHSAAAHLDRTRTTARTWAARTASGGSGAGVTSPGVV